MMRPLLSMMSPAGLRGKLSILILHRVLPAPDPLLPDEFDARRFDDVCRWVRHWFQVLPLGQAVQRLAAGRLPARAACITFDDGYADNHDVALPILQRHGLTATFFVASGYLDGGIMWNDVVIESVRRTALDTLDLHGLGVPGLGRIPLATLEQRRAAVPTLIGALKYLPDAQRRKAVSALGALARVPPPAKLMMRSGQVQALRRAGMEIGAHTASHPILARLDDAHARSEIEQGKAALEALLDEPVTLFAYPNGKPGQDFTATHVRMARACGFQAAVTTHWGAARTGADLYQLPRFTPWDRRRWRFGLRLLANLHRPQA